MSEKREVKDCPYCGEEILAKAIKCKHCKSNLEVTPDETISADAEFPAPPTPVISEQGLPPIPPLGADQGISSPGPDSSSSSENIHVAGGKYVYPKAGIIRRILAYLIDGLISALPLIIFVPLVVIPYFRYIEVQSQFGGLYTAGPGLGMIVFSVIAILIAGTWSLFYYLFRDGFGQGQSWGKAICGLMVVNLDDNSPCNMAKSFLRNIVLWLLSALAGLSIVEFILILVQDKGSRLGDMLAGTQVIDARLYKR